ncbi:hypothetical protein GGI07_003095 [Coemansia sp. Benny D115]|nr:hypothetical protein GGI07_003095 [Coemansia sp. Benny D115]
MDALIKIQADAAVHSQQQRQSLNPMSLAPADLMLGTQMSPRSPGSQVLFGSQQQMQESQDLPFGRLSTPGDLAMAVGAGSALNSASADGLAYMAGLAAATMPVATGDDVTGATTQAQQQPLPLSISLPGTAASTPQMILNGHDLDFVASLAPSAAMMLTPASAPLASASAMSLSPSLLYSDAEYSQMVLANALSAQQLAVNAAAGASMYSPPLSTTSFGVAPGVMAVTPPQTDCAGVFVVATFGD